MRIQARIFLVFSLLMAALVGVQLWIHVRQMRAVERSLGGVAAAVGREMLTREIDVFRRVADLEKVVNGESKGEMIQTDVIKQEEESLGEETGPERRIVMKRFLRRHPEGVEGEPLNLSHDIKIVDLSAQDFAHVEAHNLWVDGDGPHEIGDPAKGMIFLSVTGEEHPDRRFLQILDASGGKTKIQIPTSPTMEILQTNLRRGLFAGGILLVIGLVASALVARRLAKPLQTLAANAEEVGRGSVGLRVPITASGEIGELQAAFDRMSGHLSRLEKEREAWRRREHLAQLGDLSRGLAHTIRNPLHTLGLAVEELARNNDDTRVATARAEIRKIDRWIKSFLALGAGAEAAWEHCDVVELVQECLLELGIAGERLRSEFPDRPILVRAIPGGFRSAVGNLLENALQASPNGEKVRVGISAEAGAAVVRITDQGPGIPAVVRERLFEPHQTARTGGSGMGLFLARQLIEEMHGGQLRLEDGEGGGTVAVVILPMVEE